MLDAKVVQRLCVDLMVFKPSAASYRRPAVRQALHIQSQRNEPVEPHLKGQFTQTHFFFPTTINHLDSFALVNRFLIIGNHLYLPRQKPLKHTRVKIINGPALSS